MKENEPDSFAGLFLEHVPNFRAVIRVTGDGEQSANKYVRGSELAPIIQFELADYTMAELRAAQIRVDEIALSLGIDHHTGISVRNNRALLYVPDPDNVLETLKAQDVSLPDAVMLIQMTATVPVVDIKGGLALDANGGTCTSGFPVFDTGTNEQGITTAGHCEEPIKYNSTTLTWKDGTTGGVRDIQWNAEGSFTTQPKFYDGSGDRPLLGEVLHASQNEGAVVCKYGVTTGYGCGEIVDRDFDTYNVWNDEDVSPGDSGGPWFSSYSAYGTTISKALCGNPPTACGAIYGPVDNIYYEMDVDLMFDY